jgi:predicted DNA repair protein MutK
MTLNLALALAFLLSGLYAAFLAMTDFGLWLRQELTWLTVVIGVGITLACMMVVDSSAATTAALFFVATGLPIVVESLFRMWRMHRAVQRKQTEKRDGE